MDKYEKAKLGDLCQIIKGETGIASAEPGQYPLVTTGAERKTAKTFQFDAEAVCIPLVSSTGHGKKSLNYVHYQKGKFALGTILTAVIPHDSRKVSAAFLHRYLQFYKDRKIVPFMKGAANVSLAIKDIARIEIPVPPIEKQIAFIDLFNRTNGFNIELLSEFMDQSGFLSRLRQAILQEAIEGKLTADWRKKNPVRKGDPDTDAVALLEKIKTEKQKLIAEGKRKEKSIENTITYRDNGLPGSWIYCKGDEILFVTKLAGFEYTKYIELKKQGEIPVVRAQNVKQLVLDKTNLLFIDVKTSKILERSALTKKALLVTFIGAGIGDVAFFNERTRWHLAPNVAKMEPILEESLDLRYLNYFLLAKAGQREIFKHIKATAQPSLSMGTIRDIDYTLPPLAEQRAIVERVDRLLTMVDELEKQVIERKGQAEELMQAVLREAFEGK